MLAQTLRRRALSLSLLACAALFPSGCSTDAGPGAAAGGSPAGGAPVTATGGVPTATGGSSAPPASGGTRASGGSATGGAPSASGGTTAGGTSNAGGGTTGGTTGGGPLGGGGSTSVGTGGYAGGGANGGNASGAGGRSEGGRGGAGGGGGVGGSAPPITKKFVGNIDTRTQVRADFVNFWNQFTPENAGKWGSIERTRDEMNWSSLDRMYEYAKQHNVVFKQHTMVWGSQQPSWLSGLSQEEQRAEVEEWIRLFCERYPDTKLIDVVNEPPPHTTPPYVAALGGSGSSGYDWIAQAFKWTRQYCPNAILLLNDYNNVEYQADNARTIDIAKKIKAAGAPIDAIGAQSHDAYKMSTSTVQGYIDKIVSETGLPVYITEYDIDLADDNQQRSVMQSQFTMFWNHEKIHGITLWGYVSGQTWKANTGIMSSSGTPRPAMTWLLDFLEIP
jgi:endo-1,4-beta-xylanase